MLNVKWWDIFLKFVLRGEWSMKLRLFLVLNILGLGGCLDLSGSEVGMIVKNGGRL